MAILKQIHHAIQRKISSTNYDYDQTAPEWVLEITKELEIAELSEKKAFQRLMKGYKILSVGDKYITAPKEYKDSDIRYVVTVFNKKDSLISVFDYYNRELLGFGYDVNFHYNSFYLEDLDKDGHLELFLESGSMDDRRRGFHGRFITVYDMTSKEDKVIPVIEYLKEQYTDLENEALDVQIITKNVIHYESPDLIKLVGTKSYKVVDTLSKESFLSEEEYRNYLKKLKKFKESRPDEPLEIVYYRREKGAKAFVKVK